MNDVTARATRSDGAEARVAVAQFAPGGDGAANLAAVSRMTAEAAAQGARLVVFPEYTSAFVDPFDDTLAAHAQPLDGPFVSALVRLASAYDVHIVAGMLESASDSRHVHNTLVAVDGTGLCAHYRKLHLYDAFGQRESDWIAAGAIERSQTFTVDGIRFGLQTCYDLRFPEVTRTVVDAGAEVVLVPAQWVRGPLKEMHWQTLLAARAIENTVYVAAADHTPPQGVGRSAVVDPEGVVVAGSGTAAGVAVATLRHSEIARVRRANPALALRRFAVAPRPEAVSADVAVA